MQHIGTGDVPGSMRSRQDRLDRRPLRPRPCHDKTAKHEPRSHAADAAPSQTRREPDGCSRTRRSHQEHKARGVGGLGAGEPAGDRRDRGEQGTGRRRGHDFERLHTTAGGKHAEHHADKWPGGPLATPKERQAAARGETDRQRDISDRRHRQHGSRQHGETARLIRGCSGTPPPQPATHGERDPRRESPQVDADEQPEQRRRAPPRWRHQPTRNVAGGIEHGSVTIHPLRSAADRRLRPMLVGQNLVHQRCHAR